MCRSVFRPDKPTNRTMTSTTSAPLTPAVMPTIRGLHNATTTRVPPSLICTLTAETEILLGKFFIYLLRRHTVYTSYVVWR